MAALKAERIVTSSGAVYGMDYSKINNGVDYSRMSFSKILYAG